MEFHTGENNAIRFAVMLVGSENRPNDTEFFILPNVSTSDAPITATQVTKKYYKAKGGTTSKSTGATWTFTVSGDLPQDKEEREPVYVLRKAILAGNRIWMERAFDDDAADEDWEGGVTVLTNATLPSPSDNATTYSFTASGSGDLQGPHEAAVTDPTPTP
ncbi:phage tail tube protein [Deinococcus gobiensis]|uniref:phage tail tube protein n=1 Tax=Deinococcus gobiensis TaxID=502394 RepID=UPI0002ECF3BD|nr:hypothetical protein [Deinococcus gobiensis]